MTAMGPEHKFPGCGRELADQNPAVTINSESNHSLYCLDVKSDDGFGYTHVQITLVRLIKQL
jgi:hypothetical protein